MAQRTTTLYIASPCHESWASMTPAAAGRHCAACQKTVVNFTQKTDAEILAYLARAAGRTCGRFGAGQVGRPLVPPAPASRWRVWLSAGLALASTASAGPASAQPRHFFGAGANPVVASPGSASNAAEPAEPPAMTLNEPLTLRGAVVDGHTGERLPGVLVKLKGTRLEVATDADGNFELPIAAESSRITLVIRYIGYETTVKTIKLKNRTEPLRLRLKMTQTVLGEIAYVGPASSFLERLTTFFSRA